MRLKVAFMSGGALLMAAAMFSVQQPGVRTANGETLYRQHCLTCHDGGDGRAPGLAALKQMTPEGVLNSLANGSMADEGKPLSDAQRRAIAMFVTGKAFAPAGAAADLEGGEPAGVCTAMTPMHDVFEGPMWNGWGNDNENSRYQDAKTAGLTAEDVPKLKLKWAFGIPGVTRAAGQPAIAGGRVFIAAENGYIYSLDAKTGCIYWSFKASGSARTSINISKRQGQPNQYVAYFAARGGMVYAIDANNGNLIWEKKVEDHPLATFTGSPMLYDNGLYVPIASGEEVAGAKETYECCTFRGKLVALNATTGDVLWKTYMIDEEPKPAGKNRAGKTIYKPAGAGIWSAPTLDAKRKLIYVATGDGYTSPAAQRSDSIVALDLATGAIRWSQQMTPNDAFLAGCQPGNPNCPDPVGPDFDFGASPIVATLPDGRDLILVGQKSGMAYALDPDQKGKVVWEFRAGKGTALGGILWSMAIDKQNLYIPVGDILVRPPDQPGGLWAVKIATGEKVWRAENPKDCAGKTPCGPGAQSAAITVIPGVVFSGSVDGHIRAYSTKDGSILWDENTLKDYKTVNGVPGKGGSVDGPGPVVVDGMMYTNSGYALFGTKPGNVLLAFGK